MHIVSTQNTYINNSQASKRIYTTLANVEILADMEYAYIKHH